MKTNRRIFVKQGVLGATGLLLSSQASAYSRILGANDTLRFAVVGLNGRGKALVRAIQAVPNTEITHLCDVDSVVLEKAKAYTIEHGSKAPKTVIDYRKLLEEKDIDVIAIATPDHWHAPMTLMAVQAGKHVYVEKPCCYNPEEGEMLIEAQKKYGKLIQMGNQQRSGLASIEAIQDIREGIIGEVYHGKAWYANTRGSIGKGKEIAVPEHLDWDLWQGPAPRMPYKDNYVHYNWHWFEHWGTGEINNNGTHEIDICRWALGVDYPTKVSSSGGRYHFKDDWEFYDTQIANFEYEGGKMITWEGRSCNGLQFFQRGRGVTLHGTNGTILLDRNLYIVYNHKGEEVKWVKEGVESATTNTVGMGGLDVSHMNNLANGIRNGEVLNSPIDDGYKSNLLCHLGNISQKVGRVLNINGNNGRILNDKKAMKMWSREYEPGWEMKV
ncbi:MAG: Gfo/Idh/MocA family oxidoreductase [Bacteroidota bacterium]